MIVFSRITSRTTSRGGGGGDGLEEEVAVVAVAVEDADGVAARLVSGAGVAAGLALLLATAVAAAGALVLLAVAGGVVTLALVEEVVGEDLATTGVAFRVVKVLLAVGLLTEEEGLADTTGLLLLVDLAVTGLDAEEARPPALLPAAKVRVVLLLVVGRVSQLAAWAGVVAT